MTNAALRLESVRSRLAGDWGVPRQSNTNIGQPSYTYVYINMHTIYIYICVCVRVRVWARMYVRSDVHVYANVLAHFCAAVTCCFFMRLALHDDTHVGHTPTWTHIEMHGTCSREGFSILGFGNVEVTAMHVRAYGTPRSEQYLSRGSGCLNVSA